MIRTVESTPMYACAKKCRVLLRIDLAAHSSVERIDTWHPIRIQDQNNACDKTPARVLIGPIVSEKSNG